MRSIVATLALIVCPTLIEADDCTFDQDNQIKVLRAVALFEPGATLELD